MKTIIQSSLWLCAALLGSFNLFAQGTTIVDHPNSERDVKAAQERRVAIEKADWTAFQAAFTPDAMAYNVAGKDSIKVTELIGLWKADRPNITKVELGDGPILPLHITEGVYAGDWIFEWNDNTVWFKDGKKVQYPYHIVCHLQDGKIKSVRQYQDEARIMQQLGWTMTPPKAKK